MSSTGSCLRRGPAGSSPASGRPAEASARPRPVHGHGLDGQAEGLACRRPARSRRNRRRHDRLAVHDVVGQPRDELRCRRRPATHGRGPTAFRRACPATDEHRRTAGRGRGSRPSTSHAATASAGYPRFFRAAAFSAVAADGGRTAARWVWKVSVSGLSRFNVAATGIAARLGGPRLSVIAWVSSGCGLISMNVLWSAPAASTAWLNRTGLRRLAAQ